MQNRFDWLRNLSFVLAIAGPVLAFGQPTLADETHDRLDTMFGPSRHIPSERGPAAFFTKDSLASALDDSSGHAIGGLDAAQIVDSLKLIASEGAVAGQGSSSIRGKISLTGLPMWSQWSRDFISDVQTQLSESGFPAADIKIVPMYEPQSGGLKGVLEKARAFFPMPQDFQKPIKEEIKVAVPGVLASEVTTFLYAVQNFPPEVSVPVLSGHFGLLTALTAFRRTQGNWLSRSRSEVESFSKLGTVSMLFVLNYDILSKWPAIANDLAAQGLAGYAMQSLPAGLADFSEHQLATTALQTVFFYVTFGKGVFRWEAIASQNPERAVQARKTSAVLAPAIFWVSGPALAWASTSHQTLFDIFGYGINPGQAALGALAFAGSGLWLKPELLDFAVPIVQRFFYAPLEAAHAGVKRLGLALRERLGFDLVGYKRDRPLEDEVWPLSKNRDGLKPQNSCGDFFSFQRAEPGEIAWTN